MGMLQLLEITGMNEETERLRLSGHAIMQATGLPCHDLLDLSRIEAGVLRIQKVPVNLREIFRQTTDLFSPTAKAQGVGLEMLIHPGSRTASWAMGSACGRC